MRSAYDIHPGAIVAGKYRVRAILGRNHGLTIDAFHTSFDQRAIIRLLLPNQAAAREVERFRREARALSKIASEHVARIIDAGAEPDGSVYLIRQYIDGTDLEKHMRRVGPLPVSEAILYVLQASEAVAEAHANGIVVRDLEPSHLFLTQRTGGAPLIKLADFGTAKLISAAPEGAGPVEITGTAMFGLTPYASPELIRKARDVDARTDVWSLGAILYELLAGKPPFQGEAPALMLQITREAPQPLSQLRQDVPVDLENAIGWALAKDPDARFRNVHGFALALSPFAPPEGQLLVERIGQITVTAKDKRASGLFPSAPMPPTQRSGVANSVHGLSSDAQPLVVPEFANVPVDEDADTGVIAGSSGAPGVMKVQYPFAVAGSSGSALAPPLPVPRPSSPMLAAESSTAPLPALPPAPPPREPAPTILARPPEFAHESEQNRLLRILLAFCALGIVAAIILGVLLVLGQGSPDVAATNDSQTPSAAVTIVAAPTIPPGIATTSMPQSAAPNVSAAPSGSVDPSPTVAAADTTAAPTSTGESKSGSSRPRPPPPPPSGGGNGTLVAVSVGGPCAFSVNGASKGTTSSVRLSLKAGAYTVTCKSKSGAKSKAVVVKAGETAMAMFKQ